MLIIHLLIIAQFAKIFINFLLNLPQFKAEDVNEIRRFTLLIDEIYENKTALILQTQVAINKIYDHTKILITRAHDFTLARNKISNILG